MTTDDDDTVDWRRALARKITIPSPTLTGRIVFDGVTITGEQIVKMVRAMKQIAEQDFDEVGAVDRVRTLAEDALKP